jgi:hypothetical protein
MILYSTEVSSSELDNLKISIMTPEITTVSTIDDNDTSWQKTGEDTSNG